MDFLGGLSKIGHAIGNGIEGILGGDHNPFNGGPDIDEIARKNDKHIMLDPGEQSRLVESGRVVAPPPTESKNNPSDFSPWERLTKSPSELHPHDPSYNPGMGIPVQAPTPTPAVLQRSPQMDVQPNQLRKIRVA